MSKRKQESLFWGVILLIVGMLFMLDNLGVNINVWSILDRYWPLILIGIGLKNIARYYNRKRQAEERQEER